MTETFADILKGGLRMWTAHPLITAANAMSAFSGILVVLMMFFLILVRSFSGLGAEALSSISDAALHSLSDPAATDLLFGLIAGTLPDHLAFAALVVFAGFLVLFVLSAYFFSGAVGLIRSAEMSGACHPADFFRSAKKNLLSVTIVMILLGAISLAAFAVLSAAFSYLAAALPARWPVSGPVFSYAATAVILILLYPLVFPSYAAVMENTGVIAGFSKGFSFAVSCPKEVMLLSAIYGIFVSSANAAVSAMPYIYPLIWILMVFAVGPLMNIWSVRLYARRMPDKKEE